MSGETILIVDDQPENVAILCNFLGRHGYSLLIANDGESALDVIKTQRPDIVLLDIMMPGINGFEVCRRLKANDETFNVPVIFMTALTDTADKLEGFAAGGVDYITKPFKYEEVRARLKLHLTLFHLQRELRKRNAELEAFAYSLAHDLKTPLATISGSADLLALSCHAYMDSEMRDNLEMIQKIAGKSGEVINALLMLADTARQGAVPLEPLHMAFIMPGVKRRLSVLLKEYQAELIMPTAWPFVCGYPAWVEEIWVNLICNAIKHGGRPPYVEVGADAEQDGLVRFWVRDNGAGVSAAMQESLFTPFHQLHTKRQHGLGLSICHNIVTKLGGSIGVESAPEQGSLFYFTLPVKLPASDKDLDAMLVSE
jgi:two-component system, sensor histidine kinase and response regulator